MTTTNNCSLLKDVVAYVDVWSSDKTANYSKPFVQQLQDMGAQVSKTFSKQVTHVVFYNGHPATWSKAKKSNVKLVSALWVGRCYDDGVHVDEELYPALDETNPVSKNKKHRCMQPKDYPERTPENDRRMRKKLDQMMKGLALNQPLVTDVSPVFIDEENGIVYSPALKRSDYMAQRLKDMREKHENLSPTASQMVESCSPTRPKPSLGSTPTVLTLTFDQSDEDSGTSVAEPADSPNMEEERIQHDFTEHGQFEQCQNSQKASEKPQLLTCYDVSKRISRPLKSPDFIDKEDKKGNTPKRKGRTSIKRQPAEKHKSEGTLESLRQDRSESSKKVNKEKGRSQIKSSSPSPDKTDNGKQNENETIFFPASGNSSHCLLSPPKFGNAAFVQSKQTSTHLQKKERKTPKKARLSVSALVRSFTLSGVSGPTDGDDDVYEDYFSPANCPQKSKRPPLPDLPVEREIQFPFELLSVPNKRKQRSESTRSATNSEKKKKLEESQRGKNHDKQSDAGSEPQSHSQQDIKESLDSPSTDITLLAIRQRQSSLPFTSNSSGVAVKQTRASTSVLPTTSTEENTVLELQKASVNVPYTLERRGNEAAAGLTDIPSEDEENHNKHDSVSIQKMSDKTKFQAMGTLVMTSMPTEKQHIVGQVVKALGGFSIVDRVCESTTHVVSGGDRRTLNILLGIARGCWIVSFEWILWCLEQRQWVPEEPYELSDQFPAAQMCRLQRHLSAGEHQQDLFQSQPAMFVSQHSQPPTDSLVELIQLCGGTVCKTVRQAGICIGKYNGRRPEGSRILSEQWVLDSITHLKQLSYDNYELE